MTDFEYEVPLPGHFIQEELDARGWAQRDLAFILGVEETALNKIIRGKTGISLEMSKALATAFGVDADFFANLQKTYDMAHVPAPDAAIARRAALQNEFPVREMIKRGWLANTDVSLLEIQLKRFLRADNDDAVREIRHAAKKTSYGEPTTHAQLAWLYRVVQIAEAIECKPYSEAALGKAKPKLKALMNDPKDIERVPGVLADCGLRFVVVEGLAGAKIDGVCIWLDPKTPIVAMSLRYDRIDNFWFVLWHELAHVLHRHGRDESDWIVDVELEGDRATDSATVSTQERQANRSAADYCVPEAEMLSFISKRSFFAESDVVAFARRVHVHPGIVVGQIQNRTRKFELLRRYQVKIRQYLTSAGIADGWGQAVPISI
jgi:HTH-type transcriptional regulator/antitoxin HigA